jgi:hypothetical protein
VLFNTVFETVTVIISVRVQSFTGIAIAIGALCVTSSEIAELLFTLVIAATSDKTDGYEG